MYTELIFGAKIKRDIPQEAITALRFMFDDEYYNECQGNTPSCLPNHPFFKRARWKYMTRCISYYFGVSVSHRLFKDDKEISNCFVVSSRSNLKNYDDEITHFIDWIKPYCESGSGNRQCIAIVCYEQDDEPHMIFLKDKEEKHPLE
jgi:hypothetical protein